MTKIETPMGLFENYNQLFEFICEMDSAVKKGKLYPTHPQIEGSNWSFVVFSPDMVVALYPFTPAMDSNIKKAYDEQLSLLEIYAGDYMTPRYIALTPSVNMDELKHKWCDSYCVFHNIPLHETVEEETHVCEVAKDPKLAENQTNDSLTAAPDEQPSKASKPHRLPDRHLVYSTKGRKC